MAEGSDLVSIGLPVYNGAATLRRALDTLLAQKHRSLELIISDNASTDATRDICMEYSARDGRVRYIRQERNMEACYNFWFVLQQARGEFFMWAAADDWWHEDFVSANLAVLASRSDVIASMSKVRFYLGGRPMRILTGTYPLMDSPADNIIRHLSNPQMVGRTYSLFRTWVVRESMVPDQFWAFDVCMIAKTLKYGKYYEVDRILQFRDLLGESSSMAKILKRYSQSRWDRVLPMAQLTRRILSDRGIPKDGRLLLILAMYNMEYVLRLFFQYLHPPNYLKKLMKMRQAASKRPDGAS